MWLRTSAGSWRRCTLASQLDDSSGWPGSPPVGDESCAGIAVCGVVSKWSPIWMRWRRICRGPKVDGSYGGPSGHAQTAIGNRQFVPKVPIAACCLAAQTGSRQTTFLEHANSNRPDRRADRQTTDGSPSATAPAASVADCHLSALHRTKGSQPRRLIAICTRPRAESSRRTDGCLAGDAMEMP